MGTEPGSDDLLRRIRRLYSLWGGSKLYGFGTAVTFLGREARIRRRCIQHLQLSPGDLVLDAACGTGRNYPYLREALDDHGLLVGIDLTYRMLARARTQEQQQNQPALQLVQADLQQLPCRAGAFDGAVAVLGISVVPDFERALRQIGESLRAGGRLVVCDASVLRGRWRILNLIIKPLYRRLAAWDPEKDILGALNDHFQVESVEWFNGGSVYVATSLRNNGERKSSERSIS